MDITDRYRGCLLGLACGDALGGPVEFLSRQQVAAAHPNGLRDFIGGGCWIVAPGEITDDTQMTIALARSLARGGPLAMEDVGREFLAWVRTDPKDIGNQTRAALSNLAAGVPWEEAGDRIQRAALPKGAAGNGSVMRCAPVALRFRADPDALVQASIDTARITHADPRCTWGPSPSIRRSPTCSTAAVGLTFLTLRSPARRRRESPMRSRRPRGSHATRSARAATCSTP